MCASSTHVIFHCGKNAVGVSCLTSWLYHFRCLLQPRCHRGDEHHLGSLISKSPKKKVSESEWVFHEEDLSPPPPSSPTKCRHQLDFYSSIRIASHPIPSHPTPSHPIPPLGQQLNRSSRKPPKGRPEHKCSAPVSTHYHEIFHPCSV
jgi:hypothetical protein